MGGMAAMNGVNGQQMNQMVNGPMVQNGVNGYHTIHLNQAMAAQLQQSQHVSPVRVEQMQMQLPGPNFKAPPQGSPLQSAAAPVGVAKEKKAEKKKDDASDSDSKKSSSSGKSEMEMASRSSNRSRSGVPMSTVTGIQNMAIASSPKA